MDFSLGRMHVAIAALVPQTKMSIVQVLGTNGKGSTSSFLANISITHGIKTGLYTSPHLVSPRERILINHKMLSENDYVYFANKIYNKIQTLTYFEFFTILAYVAFHEAKVDLAIMEAGLGGQHDATTALPVNIMCYTPIDIDHQNVLGNTVQEIAKEKSSAIRSNAPIITAHQPNEALSCIRAKAFEFNAPVLMVKEMPKELRELNLRLQGEHQKENACLALKIWDEISRQNAWNNRQELITKGIKNTFIAGRMQYIAANDSHPAILLDGAHNCHGLSNLAKSLSINNYKICGIIFSCMDDKDVKKMTELIHVIANNKPILIPHIPHNPRASKNDFLAALLGHNAKAMPSLNIAIEYFLHLQNNGKNTLNTECKHNNMNTDGCKNDEKSIVLICGSLYLLSEFFKVYPEHLLNKEI